jgi:hypothetical protein
MTRVAWTVSLALTAWAMVLQVLYATHAGALWRDEASSVNFASVPTVAEMWNNFHFDNFPPLYAFVLRGFNAMGFHSDAAYRLLGFSVAVVLIGSIWIASWLIAKRPPIVALALFVLNPLAIKTDGAIRPYGLGYAFLILAIALIWAYSQRPNWKLFAFASIASVLAVQTLYQSAFFIAAAILGACVYALATKQYRIIRDVIVIGAIAACSLAIDLPHLLHDWGKTKWVGQSSFDISKTAVDWQMLGAAFWRALSTVGEASAVIWIVFAAVLVSVGLKAKETRPLIASIVVGLVAYVCFLRFSGLHAQSWYFLIVMAISTVALESVRKHLSKTFARFALIACVLMVLLSAPAALKTVQTRATSIDVVANTLKQRATANDLVLTMPWYYGVTLGRYYDGKFTTVPPLSDVRIHRYDLVQKAMETPEPIAGLMHDMEQTLRNGGTVWTIGEIILPDDNQPVPVLPPYTPGNGFSDSDYLTSWSMQIAVFLATHATKFEPVTLPNVGPVNQLENPKVVAVSGWKHKTD